MTTHCTCLDNELYIKRHLPLCEWGEGSGFGLASIGLIAYQSKKEVCMCLLSNLFAIKFSWEVIQILKLQ